MRSSPGIAPALRFLVPVGGSREERAWDILAAALLAALGVYIVLAPMRLLVMTIVFDDAFYYFKIAENIVLGHGSTFDGITITNGYHPLWMLVLTAIRAVVPGGEFFARAAVFISALFGVLAFRSFRSLLREEYGAANGIRTLAGIGFLIAFIFSVYGLETWLMTYLFVQLLRLHRRNEETLFAYPLDVTMEGVCMALLMLARLDTAIYCVALVVAASPFLRRQLRRGRLDGAWKSAAALAGPPLVLAGGYLVSLLLSTGDWRTVSHTAKTIAEIPYAMQASPRGFAHLRIVLENRVFAFMCALPIVSMCIVLWTRRARGHTAVALAAGCLVHLTAILFAMNWGEQIWYFFPFLIVVLFIAPRMWHAIPRPEAIPPRYRGLAIVFVSLVLLSGLGAKMRFDENDYGHMIMFDLAHQIPVITPDSASIGAPYSGMIGYFGERRVFALDGLVTDHAYLAAVRSGRIAKYLRERRITYFLLPFPHSLSGADSARIDFLDNRVITAMDVTHVTMPTSDVPFVWMLFRHPRE